MSTDTALFEQATRLKLRFESPKGALTVEDLWDLPLTSQTGRANLDSIAIELHRATKDATDVVSFVDAAVPANDDAQLAFAVVKHVIQVRVTERDLAKQAAERKEKKQRLLELIARKQDEELAGKSVDELRVLAESL